MSSILPDLFWLLAIASIVLIPILLAILTVMLRASCWICQEKEPSYQRAIGVVLVQVVIFALVSLILLFVINQTAATSNRIVFSLIYLLALVVVMTPILAVTYRLMLKKVSWLKGLLVLLTQVGMIVIPAGAAIVVFVLYPPDQFILP